MDWSSAVQAMMRGAQVRRVSESVRRRDGDLFGLPMFVEGQEACELAEAWTDTGYRVRVFRGAISGCLFKPSPVDVMADDWIEVPK
jgi:hypothetical protein